jgi:LacI family transcriptional regulator
MTRLLQTGIPFTAVVCGNDNMAAGAVDVARDSGLRIPDDLSVVGFDNIVFARYIYPKLSTIDYPIIDIGRMAARLVLRDVYELDGSGIVNTFKPGFIGRASVGPVAAR